MLSSHTFTLPRQFTAELTVFYYSSTLFGLCRGLCFGQVTVGLQKLLPNDRGTLSNIFWTDIGRYNSTIPALNINITAAFVRKPRVFRLTYFGSKTVKSASSRATGSG